MREGKVDGLPIEGDDSSVKLVLAQFIIDELVTLINLSVSFFYKDFYEVKLPKLSSPSSVN